MEELPVVAANQLITKRSMDIKVLHSIFIQNTDLKLLKYITEQNVVSTEMNTPFVISVGAGRLHHL